MPRRPRVLLDVNVVLDVLQRREPLFEDSASLMAAVESGRCEGLMAAHTVTTLFYLVTKHASAAVARVQVVELLRLLKVAPVDQGVLEEALALPYGDLEDSVQMAAAERAGAEYLVTRDRAGYAAGPLPTLTPGELLGPGGRGLATTRRRRRMRFRSRSHVSAP
ncbi:MAG: PIN domain-containing protein [Thermoleophilia bacterium]|nr:PIN domain-containing protein [Thermoleophilia bacterium]